VKTILSCRPRVKGRERFREASPLIEQLASRVAPENGLVEINLVGERRISELNRIYRRRAGAPEILTFTYDSEPGRGRPQEDSLGEIFLCWPRLVAGAGRRRIPAKAYMLRLLAHGLCHMKGYRHDSGKGVLTMEGVEKKLLRGILTGDVIARLFE
jgi:probable rRNA maturation factor